MAFRLTSDAHATARSRRRTRLAAESFEPRALMAADVAPAIAPIAISCEPVPGAVGEVVTALPMPTVFIGEGGASSPGFAGSISGSSTISGEPVMVVCVMPEPGVMPGFEKPEVISGGPDGGVENVMYTTAMVQRTNTPRVSLPRPAALVAQQRYGQPRITPAIQQASGPRRNNEVQFTAAATTRPQQTPGHFARQIAARFGRVGGLVSR